MTSMGSVTNITVLVYTVRKIRAHRQIAGDSVSRIVHKRVLLTLRAFRKLSVVHRHPLDSLPRERGVTAGVLVKHSLEPATLDALIRIDILAFTCGRRVRPARLKVEGNSCEVSVSDDAAIFLSGFNLHTQNTVACLVNRA